MQHVYAGCSDDFPAYANSEYSLVICNMADALPLGSACIALLPS